MDSTKSIGILTQILQVNNNIYLKYLRQERHYECISKVGTFNYEKNLRTLFSFYETVMLQKEADPAHRKQAPKNNHLSANHLQCKASVVASAQSNHSVALSPSCPTRRRLRVQGSPSLGADRLSDFSTSRRMIDPQTVVLFFYLTYNTECI